MAHFASKKKGKRERSANKNRDTPHRLRIISINYSDYSHILPNYAQIYFRNSQA